MRITDLLREIESEAAIGRQGAKPLGVRAILRQDPHSIPLQPKTSPSPSFHAISRAVREELRQAYSQFVDAAAKLRAGDRSAMFPPGSFPPAQPFVAAAHPT